MTTIRLHLGILPVLRASAHLHAVLPQTVTPHGAPVGDVVDEAAPKLLSEITAYPHLRLLLPNPMPLPNVAIGPHQDVIVADGNRRHEGLRVVEDVAVAEDAAVAEVDGPVVDAAVHVVVVVGEADLLGAVEAVLLHAPHPHRLK